MTVKAIPVRSPDAVCCISNSDGTGEIEITEKTESGHFVCQPIGKALLCVIFCVKLAC